MPATLTATYRIVTPMFIGDADRDATEITPASVKGALRFWWRALNWGKFRNPEANDEAALRKLHAAEAELFGAAADDKIPGRGQGKFLLRVKHGVLKGFPKDALHPEFKPTRQKNGQHWPDQNHLAAARYLGYGLLVAATTRNRETQQIEKEAGQLERSCFDINQTFEVQLLFRHQIDYSIIDAVKALGLMGGLGSRVRHGFGSIALVSLEGGNEKFQDVLTEDCYLMEIKKLFKSPNCLSMSIPVFSAFSKTARIDYLFSEKTCYRVLDCFGQAMLTYRSWGRTANGNILPDGSISEKRFKDDHDWSKGMGKTNFHPRRIVFGLPHNYGRDHHQEVKPAEHERRASPLIFHVHQVGKSFIGIAVFLQSQFLPHSEGINAGGKNVPAKIEWDLLTDFITGSNAHGQLRFATRKPILEATP